MVGLVNSAGAYQSARVLSSQNAGEREKPGSEKLAPVLNAEQAANRVLKTAVEAIQFHESGSERDLPGGDTSDSVKQAELEQKSPLGAKLDLTA